MKPYGSTEKCQCLGNIRSRGVLWSCVLPYMHSNFDHQNPTGQRWSVPGDDAEELCMAEHNGKHCMSRFQHDGHHITIENVAFPNMASMLAPREYGYGARRDVYDPYASRAYAQPIIDSSYSMSGYQMAVASREAANVLASQLMADFGIVNVTPLKKAPRSRAERRGKRH